MASRALQRDFNTWAALELHVQQMRLANETAALLELGQPSHLLFRGHGNAEWGLDTTLERANRGLTDLAAYYRAASVAKTQIETFTGRTWADINYRQVVAQFRDYDFMSTGDLPSYDFLVYLRHHGFPSPLLDWSRSLYIAAFFAFEEPRGDRVALFVYQETHGHGKSGSSDQPRILQLGPNVRSHQRHFLQQGEYTMSCQYMDDRWHFTPHREVFELGHIGQDRLEKLTVPASEAAAVLAQLEQYNISAFSLYQSEEALMKTLARQVLFGPAATHP